ncbi:hypothetical protein C5167_011063 [Papaver somniferum]|uniref:Uncharacterized protein n=1 Tax=Papaver somniferum TaxID=3469 RepID=A0A4Y7K4V9_PAPSO|nr:hypothetical protein C5167_011063 [Papaver somniferum]
MMKKKKLSFNSGKKTGDTSIGGWKEIWFIANTNSTRWISETQKVAYRKMSEETIDDVQSV